MFVEFISLVVSSLYSVNNGMRLRSGYTGVSWAFISGILACHVWYLVLLLVVFRKTQTHFCRRYFGFGSSLPVVSAVAASVAGEQGLFLRRKKL